MKLYYMRGYCHFWQLIGIIFACCLARSIKKEYETVWGWHHHYYTTPEPKKKIPRIRNKKEEDIGHRKKMPKKEWNPPPKKRKNTILPQKPLILIPIICFVWVIYGFSHHLAILIISSVINKPSYRSFLKSFRTTTKHLSVFIPWYFI